MCASVIHIVVPTELVPMWGPEPMAMDVVLLGTPIVNCAHRKEFTLVPGGVPGRRELCEVLTYVEVPPKSGPHLRPEPMGMDVFPLGGATLSCPDVKELPLVT